jgi:hypothetical protein
MEVVRFKPENSRDDLAAIADVASVDLNVARLFAEVSGRCEGRMNVVEGLCANERDDRWRENRSRRCVPVGNVRQSRRVPRYVIVAPLHLSRVCVAPSYGTSIAPEILG